MTFLGYFRAICAILGPLSTLIFIQYPSRTRVVEFTRQNSNQMCLRSSEVSILVVLVASSLIITTSVVVMYFVLKRSNKM